MGQFCIISDRGMISAKTMQELEKRNVPYILGTRMRKVNEVKRDVLSRAGRYREVYPEASKDPSPLKVKEVSVNGNRYIVCLNTKQARKDAFDREIIIDALREKLKKDPGASVGNQGSCVLHFSCPGTQKRTGSTT